MKKLRQRRTISVKTIIYFYPEDENFLDYSMMMVLKKGK